jgi:hypothetical protein
MALCSSGTMALGGSTTGRSVNLELGCSATASINMNRTDVRTLAQRSSGSISMSHFYGKSSAPPAPTQIGTYYADYGGYYIGTADSYYKFVACCNTSQNRYKWATTQANHASDSTTNGYNNTYQNNNSNFPHYQYVAGITLSGKSDWYTPACQEFKCYSYRALTGQLANTFNANQCPPGQNMWTSTECTVNHVWGKNAVSDWGQSSGGQFQGTVKEIAQMATRPMRRTPV